MTDGTIWGSPARAGAGLCTKPVSVTYALFDGSSRTRPAGQLYSVCDENDKPVAPDKLAKEVIRAAGAEASGDVYVIASEHGLTAWRLPETE